MDEKVLRDLTAVVLSLKSDLDRRHEENTVTLESVSAKVDSVLAGFPEGDPAGHRKFHEALIKRAEARARMYQEITGDIITKGLWLALLGIGAILVKYFLQWVRGA